MSKPFINYSAAIAEELKDWTDYAGTAFALGKFLGIYHPGQHLVDVLDEVLSVDPDGANGVSLGLSMMVSSFLSMGVIEANKALDKYRWVP